MDHNFWHQRWQQQQIGFHRDAFHELLTEYFPQACPTGRILVPLCGKTKDMLWLLDQGYKVFGIELSELAVQAFFAENQLKPQVASVGNFKQYALDELVIWVGDVFDLTPKDLADVDGWYDRAALVALPPEMRTRYVELLRQALPSGSRGLLVTVEYPDGYREGPPFSVPEDEVKSAYGQRFKVQRRARIQGFVNNEPSVDRPVTEQAYVIYD
ncbi:thiopurine S-methyltransferase [Pseudidiomarina sp. YC-516-91]|uniref:thiopurine S-methyltransferase n=1 Tax=Pseudidiomarina salilacus TaxID=3384452 RepID=UPI003984F28B